MHCQRGGFEARMDGALRKSPRSPTKWRASSRSSARQAHPRSAPMHTEECQKPPGSAIRSEQATTHVLFSLASPLAPPRPVGEAHGLRLHDLRVVDVPARPDTLSITPRSTRGQEDSRLEVARQPEVFVHDDREPPLVAPRTVVLRHRLRLRPPVLRVPVEPVIDRLNVGERWDPKLAVHRQVRA